MAPPEVALAVVDSGVVAAEAGVVVGPPPAPVVGRGRREVLVDAIARVRVEAGREPPKSEASLDGGVIPPTPNIAPRPAPPREPPPPDPTTDAMRERARRLAEQVEGLRRQAPPADGAPPAEARVE